MEDAALLAVWFFLRPAEPPLQGGAAMIQTELIFDRVLKITVPEKLKAGDFRQLAPQIDSLLQQQGNISLFVDASNFGGWEDIAAFEKHIGFVKNHHQKVERIAVIVGHNWQYWVIGTMRLFLHPEVRTFDRGEEREALEWITGQA
ncbi:MULTISPECIES: SpoIIAA family protein [Bradyrhizobium]|uniref:STAS/SEC14 domain-containing protein n=1 Tax=Bradyrhizobium elkanii TaxID=29448 RepID=UPI0003F72939|nr:STAS/SEC14 domain-containing protein [Bradyrhizobium elkanii]